MKIGTTGVPSNHDPLEGRGKGMSQHGVLNRSYRIVAYQTVQKILGQHLMN